MAAEHWGAGKVIGGSSSINGQVWTRGNAADYDECASSARTAGYPYNGDHQLGVGYMQLSQRRGWRASAARAYLAPARRRPNLRLAKQALTTRIIIEGDRAVAVEYRQGGTTHTASCSATPTACGR